jgi:nucleotide sugar dehydrogenase
MSQKQAVCILGMGFVGLTLAVVMAECGHKVVGIEINPDTVRRLSSGNAHFYEIGLEARLRRVIQSGALCITGDIKEAAGCRVFILTVGTPLDKGGNPRMDMVERAASEVASVMPADSMVILRSTVRLGTTRKVVKPILDKTGQTYALAYCPERTIEGDALAELRSLPQICGGLTPDDAWRAASLFQSLTPTTVRVSSLEAAELVKLLDNSYRDLTFAFGNEVAMICEAAGLNANEIIRAGKLGYSRTNIAKPGLVGGPCLEKDPHILAHGLRDFHCEPRLISTGRDLNERLPEFVAKELARELAAMGGTPKIAVCGIAFKGRPETDDLRGSPSKFVLDALRKSMPKASVVVQDFACTDAALTEYTGLPAVSIQDAFRDASLVVVANNNKRYEGLDVAPLLGTMRKGAILYDFWNVVSVDAVTIPNGVRCYTLGAMSAARSKA